MTHDERWREPAAWVVAEGGGSLARWAAGQAALRHHVLFATSGSGGTPQRVALSKHALRVSARAVNRHLGVGPESRWGLALPFRHVGGFGVWLRAREAGCGLAEFREKWQAERFHHWLLDVEISHLSLVPTQVHDLVAAGLRAPAGLRVVVVGGGALGARLGTEARVLGWPVLASYGLTEAGSQVATAPLEAVAEPYQAAPLRVLPHWQVRVDDGGRLWLRGEALFSGWIEREAGDWRWRAREGEWHATQDRAEVGTDAWLTPLGRLDLVVKVLGELVDPAAVEDRLAELGGSALGGRVVVVPVPDPRAGHRLVLVAEEALGRELLARALEKYHREAAGFARLAGPVWLASLPRGPLGKPRRAAIAAKLAADAFRG
jgi:O-succinylbenzoic acid--CoA ligase